MPLVVARGSKGVSSEYEREHELRRVAERPDRLDGACRLFCHIARREDVHEGKMRTAKYDDRCDESQKRIRTRRRT